jgi:Tfp pilus assembly protein PilF
MPKAKDQATKALQLDDSLAEAHTSLAVIKVNFEFDWAGAENEFKRAIELNPNYAEAHHQYGWLLAESGRPAWKR